ncbi:hypothetical protein S7711_11433 [Stachybotrys chartarum IBT 7711]|uniref:Transcription factor domain-containing protein n=1 Tax=Stachybotrys chartarum (strain CBS 109288 / IBT 7711) TaxID=1280523 RepID=A0A084AUY8_STACB|nr:hypothetical protein S7711_11433 [Stachybotrys chartarum IBT 7711]
MDPHHPRCQPPVPRSWQALPCTLKSPSPEPWCTLIRPNIPAELGRPPPPEVARMLFMTYFQTWHRFFPFLHGPTVGKDIELLYLSPADVLSFNPAGPRPAQDREPSLPLAHAIILQCLFNLLSLHEKVQLPAISRIDRPIKFLSYFLELATKGDISSI